MKYGDVLWVDLPDREGHEQRGSRPCVIFQDTVNFPLPTVLIIPLTGKPNATRFPGTVLIQPTPRNGLSSPSVALVFQLGACDVSRLRSHIVELDDSDLQRLQDLAKRLQKLP